MPEISQTAITLGYFFAAIIGVGFGNFMTGFYYRLPNNLPLDGQWKGKKPHCPVCGYMLKPIEYLPLLNWIWTKGRCSNCKSKISIDYFYLEFITPIFSVLCYHIFGFTQYEYYLLLFGFSACLILAMFIDKTYGKIPDKLINVMILLGVAYRVLLDEQITDLIMSAGFAVLFTFFVFRDVYKKICKKSFEDFKYLKIVAVSGVWLDIPYFIIYAALIGLCVVLFYLVKLFIRKEEKKLEYQKLFFINLSIPLIIILIIFTKWQIS